MSIFRRMFSGGLRAAQRAEALGNLDVAAREYGVLGDRDGAVRMHMARAARAHDRRSELAALRDAVTWAGDEPALRELAGAALGRALWAALQAEGIATARDQEQVREAAAYLAMGKLYQLAGDALTQIDALDDAAAMYSQAGNVDAVEATLGRLEQAHAAARLRHDAQTGYHDAMAAGQRELARTLLKAALDANVATAEQRRQLDELERALLMRGRLALVEVRRTPGLIDAHIAQRWHVVEAAVLTLGRDSTCEVPLPAFGISRRHCELRHHTDGWNIRDLDSRNGTCVDGLPVVGTLGLPDVATLELGDGLTLSWQATAMGGRLQGQRGSAQGLTIWVLNPGASAELVVADVAVRVGFRAGRPYVEEAGAPITIAGRRLGPLAWQLIVGDCLEVAGLTLEVV